MNAIVGFIAGVAVTLLLYCLVRPVVEWGLRRWHRSNLPHGTEAWDMYIGSRHGRVARAKALYEYEVWKANHGNEEEQQAAVRLDEDVRPSDGNPTGEDAGGSGGGIRLEHSAEHRDGVPVGSSVGLSGRGSSSPDRVSRATPEPHGSSKEPAEDAHNLTGTGTGTGTAPAPREAETFEAFLKRRGEELNL